MRKTKIALPNQYPGLAGIVLAVACILKFFNLGLFLFGVLVGVVFILSFWLDRTCKFSRRRRKLWYGFIIAALTLITCPVMFVSLAVQPSMVPGKYRLQHLVFRVLHGTLKLLPGIPERARDQRRNEGAPGREVVWKSDVILAGC